MIDQEKPAGWKVEIHDYDKNRNLLRTRRYLVAIPDEMAMIAAMHDQYKLAALFMEHAPASEDDLRHHGVRTIAA